jgi:hypothetical protein
MYCRSMQTARFAAQDNADYFGVPYCVFFDTNQNAHCERYTTQRIDDPNRDVYYPLKTNGATGPACGSHMGTSTPSE